MDTRAGKLTKQGPLLTLTGASFGASDKLIYNGKQFIKFTPKSPYAIEASAHSVLYITDTGVIDNRVYATFKNSDGEFRFIDGNPTYSGEYSGTPTADYHYVVIGYDTPITTDTVTFWAEEYIPVELIRIDYSHDGNNFFTVPTHVGNVSYSFDDSLKIYDTESSPAGQFVYSVSLGENYTARYWRIRSFIYSHNTAAVSDLNGNDVVLATASGLPSSSSYYGSGDFYYNSKLVSSELITNTTSYSTVSYDGTKYTMSDVVFTPGSELGTVYASNATVSLEEYIYNTETVLRCDECKCGSFVCLHGSPEDYPECFSYETSTTLESTNILYQTLSYSDVTLTASPQSVALDVVDFMPNYDGSSVGPSGGEVVTVLRYIVDEKVKQGATYTSITDDTLEAVNINSWDDTDDLSAGNYFLYTYPMKLTQVRLMEKQGPQLTFWESDGDVSVSNLVSLDSVYDAVFDSADNVFYVVGFKSGEGTGNPVIQDDFSSGVGSSFDTDRWSWSGNGFYRDSTDEALVFSSTVSGVHTYGVLDSKSHLTGDYIVSLNVEVGDDTKDGFFGLYSLDKESNNEMSYTVIYGDWSSLPAASLAGCVVSSIENYTDGIVAVRNLRMYGDDLPSGTFSHRFSYNNSSWYYERVNVTSPGVNEVSSTDVGVGPFINTNGISLMLDSGGRSINTGSYVYIQTESSSVVGPAQRSLVVSTSYTSASNSITLSYNDGSAHIILTSTSAYADTGMKVSIRGNTDNYVTVSSTAVSSSGDMAMDVPCLYVSVMDEEGALSSVTGVSDASGNVIPYFDVIADTDYTYDTLFGQVSIATTHEPFTAGGSIFIRVGEDLYKYNKASLPILSNEDGSSAVATVSGVFPSKYVYGFLYDDYVTGGLSYLWEDEVLAEVHLNVISDSTLNHSTESVWLDLSSADVPYTRDVNDLGVIYTIDDTSVYVFNADEDSVAFCNVVATDPILPASSDYDTTITARVTNLFGQPLPHKTVSFVVTDGGGTLSAASACTTSSGTASVTFTSSSVQGTSSIMATASDDSC